MFRNFSSQGLTCQFFLIYLSQKQNSCGPQGSSDIYHGQNLKTTQTLQVTVQKYLCAFVEYIEIQQFACLSNNTKTLL